MGGKSRSSTSSAQTTQNIQDIDTTTVGIEDSEGAIAGGRDVSVVQISTDQGAIEAGSEVARAGLATGREIGEASLDFAGEFGSESLKRSFDFGKEALGTTERGLSEALDFGSGTVTDAFEFGSGVVSDALAKSAAQSQQTAQTLSGAIERASAATRSDTSQGLQKIVLYVAAAGAALGIGYFAFRKG